MSQENVVGVRRGFEAMERGDLAALLAGFDERVVTRRVAPAPNPGTRHGKEGVLEDMAEWFEGFDDISVKIEECIDAGDDVFVEVRQKGHGAASGAPVEAVFWFVFGFEAGKVIRFDLYADREQALEAVGLSEQAMSRENVEIVRRVTEEFTETQQVSDLVSPNVVWHVGSWSAWTGQSEFYGHEGFMEFFAEWIDAYEEWTQEVESIVDAGGSQVVEITRQQGRLPGSESWAEMRYGIVYTVEEGSITRGRLYGTSEEALEAVGLSG